MDQDLQKLEFSDKKPLTPILDTINYPIHMKNLSTQELVKLTDELRAEIVHTVSKTGGHLSASLGVTELTVALHHVFNTPEDKIIWDVGHQTSGLAGFPKRDESVHDAFGAGHSSTSISAGLGMAVGQELLGKKNRVVAVIGDGAMTAGQAYEAMNNAGYLDTNLIIVLNDNKQVSLPTATVDGPAPPVGALSRALTRLHSSRKLRMLREAAKVGRGRVVREGSRVAILGFGTILQSCVAAGDLLKEIGVSATIADARFCKPLDGELIRSLAREHEVLITVEEGSIGGFGSHVSHFLALNGLLDQNLKWRAMMLPDRYIEHGSQKEQMEEAGLSARHIAATVLSLIGENKDALHHLC
ncbi:hypothetical protein QJS10_CPB18g00226 [Acorus calamus]|uniref:1-deoxy-D-xylulose-5-phosphate synthase n=1 Tax=Acorus calamus TaxID=4465 RepID=A0AAV9CPZ1_ACOCL|nr:hypothetical protein QJS10_CPB18g00226 [Acorus calamus]